jgi:hypothetical protein
MRLLLEQVLDELGGEDLEAFSIEAEGEGMREVRAFIDRLEGEFGRRLAHFTARRGYEASGALDPIAWVRSECRLSFGEAAERVQLARGLAGLPETAAALARGQIGYQHATVIARAAEEVGPKAATELEEIAIEAATSGVDPGRLRQFTRQYRAHVDPEGFLDAANREYARRRLSYTQGLDGMFTYDGLFDVEGGTVLRTALESLMGPPAADDKRTPAQRRADAMIELARQLLGDGGGSAAGSRTQIALTAPLSALRREAGAPAAELDDIFPVPQETLRRLSCDASIIPVVTSDEGDPLHMGRTVRTWSTSQRRGLAVRDKGCRFPGCDRPVRWCDGHHIKHWADGGPTNKENGALLCRRHHRLVHEEGWTVRWGEDGQLVATPP